LQDSKTVPDTKEKLAYFLADPYSLLYIRRPISGATKTSLAPLIWFKV
jgi:hypothetical protein